MSQVPDSCQHDSCTTISLVYMTSLWPFSTWGIDIIDEIIPKSSNGNKYIMVTIDYLTKWVNVASYTKLEAKEVANFIKKNISCQYAMYNSSRFFLLSSQDVTWKIESHFHRHKKTYVLGTYPHPRENRRHNWFLLFCIHK